MRLLIAFWLMLLMQWQVCGATWFVTTNGNNVNSGMTTNDAWRNIWYASRSGSSVSAGDTVQVGPGEFNEYETNSISGTSGNNITYTGTRSGTNWLTTIDPSVAITNWLPAPEIGAGVWKTTNAPFPVTEMQANGQRLYYIYTTNTTGWIGSVITNSDIVNGRGIDLLTQAVDRVVSKRGTSWNFWDPVGALWCKSTNGEIHYIRFKNGDDPNTNNVRGASNTIYDNLPYIPAVRFTERSNIVFQNFKIKGAYSQLFISGSNAHNITLRSNSVCGGGIPLMLSEGPHDCQIIGNDVFGNDYAWTNHGAYTTSTNISLSMLREQTYLIGKYWMGYSSSRDQGINIFLAGSSNVFAYNYVHHGGGEGFIVGPAGGATLTYSHGLNVFSNTISHKSSAGIFLGIGNAEALIHDNLVEDTSNNFRLHPLDNFAETNRLYYVYRNRSYLPHMEGNHMSDQFWFFWGDPVGGPACTNIYYWIYHNSFSGGIYGAIPNGNAAQWHGAPGVRLLNNVFSDQEGFSAWCTSFYTGWCTNGNGFGKCDYNLITVPYGDGVEWWGGNNITNAPLQWANVDGITFALTNGSAAIDAALDTTATFTLQGTEYPALPQSTAIKYGSAWDMGALEYSSPAAESRILRVGTFSVNP